MELIIGFGLGVLGIIAAAASRQLADEFKAWTPWIIERLVKHAVRTLPEAWRDRFEEEWLSHIRETPGEVGKIMAAFGFLFAARQMSSPIIFPKRCLDVVAALATLFVVAPLFLFIAAAIKFEDGGPIFATRATKRPNRGRGPALLEFRTTSLAATGGYTRVGRLLRPGHLDLLPILINVLRGDTIFLSGRGALTLIFPFLALSGLLVFLVMRS
jgi:hypothetical protein